MQLNLWFCVFFISNIVYILWYARNIIVTVLLLNYIEKLHISYVIWISIIWINLNLDDLVFQFNQMNLHFMYWSFFKEETPTFDAIQFTNTWFIRWICIKIAWQRSSECLLRINMIHRYLKIPRKMFDSTQVRVVTIHKLYRKYIDY